MAAAAQPVADRCRGHDGHFHGGPRHLGGERGLAAHRRKSFGNDRRSDLGVDELPGVERHHSARYRLAGKLFWPQRLLVTCIFLFTLASMLCGTAGSLGFLIFARVFQGAGGGAMLPISQAVLLESFPPARRGAAMAVFAMGVVVAPILGPTLGGWITDNYSWRWIFYINLPIGIFAALMANEMIE